MNDSCDGLTKAQRIGKRIKAERTRNKNRSMSQILLAGKLNTTQNTISNWERGKAIPPMDQLIRISGIFGCDVAYLLCDYDERSKETAAISEVTGLSVVAIERLKELQERAKKEQSAGWRETYQEQELKAINTLLECGLTTLDYVYQYLYGDYNTYWMLTQGEHGEDKDVCADDIMMGYKGSPDGPGIFVPIGDARETFMLKIQRELVNLYNLLHAKEGSKDGKHKEGN